jgi:uncharacterized cupredoxin-like copper-binding protein
MKRTLSFLFCLLMLLSLLPGVAAADCDHQHVQTDYEDDTTYTPIDGDDRYHEALIKGTVHFICLDCGEEVDTDTSEPITEQQMHSYDENGVCTQCGHKNACKHASVYSYASYTDDKVTFTSINDKYHKMTGEVTLRSYCEDCGMNIATVVKTDYVEKQWHDYDKDGVCTQCGHKNACKHSAFYTYRDWDWETRQITDDKNGQTHTISGSGDKVRCCNDCGMVLTRTPFTNEKETEQHYYDSKGVCDCGYSNVCKHEHIEEYTGLENITSAKAVDGTTCSVTGEGILYQYCEDCGANLKRESLGTITEERSHYFVNGVCEYCGYSNECKHTDTYSYTYADLADSYSDINDISHTVHGDIVTCTCCNVCGAELQRTVKENGTLTENHNYRGEACLECGHVNSCKHAHKAVSVSFIPKETTWTCVDSNTHKGSGMGYEYSYCADCEEGFGWSDKKQVEEVRDHQFDKDGKCTACGYVKGAEPALYAAAKVNTVKVVVKKSAKLTAPKVKKATYQWYYRVNKTAAWQPVPKGTKNTLKPKATMATDGYQYRCVIKSGAGVTYTDVYELYVYEPLKIKKQPKWGKNSVAGAKVTLSITAQGADTYQWVMRPNSSAAWSKIEGATASSYVVDVQDGMAGYQYACQVTGRAGTAQSKAATVKMAKVKAPKVSKHPTWKKAVKPGDVVTLTIKAQNADTYQWYYRTSAKGAWIIYSGATQPTLKFQVKAGTNGFEYRCTVKGKGGTADSKSVTLKVVEP